MRIVGLGDTFAETSPFERSAQVVMTPAVVNLDAFETFFQERRPFFVAGILIGESPILTKHIDEQLRGIVTAFFAPVFFGMAGLATVGEVCLYLGLVLVLGSTAQYLREAVRMTRGPQASSSA